jgi:hypothetical protein
MEGDEQTAPILVMMLILTSPDVIINLLVQIPMYSYMGKGGHNQQLPSTHHY